MMKLKNEVENKLAQNERWYNEEVYYIDLGDERQTKNKAMRIKRLGYNVVKDGSQYKISR